jgi:hypothetical protein
MVLQSNDNGAMRVRCPGCDKFVDTVLQGKGYGSVQVRRLGGLSTVMTAVGRKQTADSRYEIAEGKKQTAGVVRVGRQGVSEIS